MILGWSSAAKSIEKWSIAGETNFQFECPNNESRFDLANQTVWLYRKNDESGNCQKQFETTTVTFDKGKSASAAVRILNNCSHKSALQTSANATSLEYVKFLARRLNVDDEAIESRGDCELMGSFEFYKQEKTLNNGTTVLSCIVGNYTVKSKQPLWALSSEDSFVNSVVGIWKIILALFWFAIACGAGFCCGCVGLCCLCVPSV